MAQTSDLRWLNHVVETDCVTGHKCKLAALLDFIAHQR
jgi:hypothetical protein